jgi:hypothetical protein
MNHFMTIHFATAELKPWRLEKQNDGLMKNFAKFGRIHAFQIWIFFSHDLVKNFASSAENSSLPWDLICFLMIWWRTLQLQKFLTRLTLEAAQVVFCIAASIHDLNKKTFLCI